MYDRTFGVEIECGYNRTRRSDVPDPYSEAVYGACEGHWCRNDHVCYCLLDEMEDDSGGGCDTAERLLRKNGFKDWATEYIHPDGSGVEIPSPILRGEKGLDELQKVMVLLSNNGFYVTRADGMHVHHGAEDYVNDAEAVIRLAESWLANERLIECFVDPYRINHYPCSKNVNPEIINRMKIAHEGIKKGDQLASNSSYYGHNGEGVAVNQTGRGALNTSALSEHGTVEFRLHEGTLDPKKATAWVKFGHYFMEAVVRRKSPITCEDVPTLLKRIRITKDAAETLLERAGVSIQSLAAEAAAEDAAVV